MGFKTWLTPYLNEYIAFGYPDNQPNDITNVGTGVRSKYISDEEAGFDNKSVDTADFGVDNQKAKATSKKINKLKRLKSFRNLQRRNYV